MGPTVFTGYRCLYPRGDVVTTNPYPVVRLRMDGTVSRLTHIPSRGGAELKHRGDFIFVLWVCETSPTQAL